jgi:hypothetical protein
MVYDNDRQFVVSFERERRAFNNQWMLVLLFTERVSERDRSGMQTMV